MKTRRAAPGKPGRVLWMLTVRWNLTSSLPPYRLGGELSIEPEAVADPGPARAGLASYEPERGDNGGQDPTATAFALTAETPLQRTRRLATNRQRKRRGLPPIEPGQSLFGMSRSVTLCHAYERDNQRDSVTDVTGGKGGVFLHLTGKKKAHTAEKTEEKTEQHPPSVSPPARDMSRSVTLHDRDKTPASVTSVTSATAPPTPPDWGFDTWWDAWARTAERLNSARIGSRPKALVAWKQRRHALDPSQPHACLIKWAQTKEWADRGKLPNPERFLDDDKYTPARRAPWRPSAAFLALDHEQWCLAIIDATADLQGRGLLTPARAAVLDKAADDRSLLNDQFWHGLLADTPTFRNWQLYHGRHVPASPETHDESRQDRRI